MSSRDQTETGVRGAHCLNAASLRQATYEFSGQEPQRAQVFLARDGASRWRTRGLAHAGLMSTQNAARDCHPRDGNEVPRATAGEQSHLADNTKERGDPIAAATDKVVQNRRRPQTMREL